MNMAMTGEDKARQLFRQLQPFDLPIGVYLVTKEGRFLECDRRVREILALPLDGPVDASILNFYRDPSDRGRLIRKTVAAEAKGRNLEGEIIAFEVEGRQISVRDYCRPLRDPETNTVIGYVGCLVDVTEEEHYQQLFEHLPAGVYQVDTDDKLVRVNEALVRMFGYRARDEIEGLPVRRLYADPGRSDAFRGLVETQGSVVNQVEEFVKMGGGSLFASISAFRVSAPDGSYAGFEGTLIDVTAEERYRRLLNYVPVGFYEIRLENGQGVISECNEQFACMFDYDSPEEMVGTPVRQLYAFEGDHARFLAEIEAKDRVGQPLHGFPLRVRSRLGREFTIEVNSRLLRDREGKVMGRTGVVLDITEEAELRERYDRLLSDVGRVLHPFSSTLLMVQHTLKPVGRALGDDPFEKGQAPTAEEADAALVEPTGRLARALEKMLALAESERSFQALPRERWSELTELLDLLREYRYTVPIEFRTSALRDAAHKVIETCASVRKGVLAQEPVRQVRRSAQDLERLACHIDLHLARTTILQMDHQVHALRDFVTAGARTEEASSVCIMSDLVAEAIRRLIEFARNRGVEIEQRGRCPQAHVKVVERDVVRALTNLLHNAIKYSWHAGPDRTRWVTVDCQTVGDNVRVTFENYGVPIAREEIEQELIFQVGYRGRLSRDRGRMGTGIGLADARAVARRYGGDVEVRSHSAHADRAEDDYTAPFLTSATLALPLHIKGRAGHHEV
jgi:PAS domain S-box-containing protein